MTIRFLISRPLIVNGVNKAEMFSCGIILLTSLFLMLTYIPLYIKIVMTGGESWRSAKSEKLKTKMADKNCDFRLHSVTDLRELLIGIAVPYIPEHMNGIENDKARQILAPHHLYPVAGE